MSSRGVRNFIRDFRTELRQQRDKALALLIAVLFACVLALAFVLNLVLPDKHFSAAENRALQELPSFSAAEWLQGRYESKFEDYANDQFLLRGAFVRLKTAVDLTEGKLEANGVYRARDSYLIEDITVPESEQLEQTEAALQRFHETYPELNAAFLLAPNAGNILSDKLPLTVHLADQDQLIDDFYAYITEAGYQTIDVRETFREARDDTQLYYRTDHHWTSDGAYLAYRQLVQDLGVGDPLTWEPQVVKRDFLGTLASKSGFTGGRYDAIKICLPPEGETRQASVYYYSDTQEKTTRYYELGNLNKKDAYTVFGGNNHPMFTVKTPVSGGRRLLLLKDSYANSMIPLLAQHYQEIVVVDPRYYYEPVSDLIEAEGITDVLFLYNANTLFGDDSLAMLLS